MLRCILLFVLLPVSSSPCASSCFWTLAFCCLNLKCQCPCLLSLSGLLLPGSTGNSAGLLLVISEGIINSCKGLC